MNRILLLGGSGILGSEVLVQLQQRNIDYAAPLSSDLDVRNRENLERQISEFKPNWIINCSAWTNVDGAEDSFEAALELNAVTVKSIGDIAKEFGCHVVHISTDYVFDGDSPEPYREDAAVNPVNKYGQSKLQGEIALLEVLPESAYVIRTSWLYGARGKNFVKTMAKKALHDESANVVDDQQGSPTNARDLANGIIDLIESQPQPGVYHYSNTGSCTWFELAQSIYKKVGADSKLVSPISSSTLDLIAKRPRFSLLSKEKWKSAGLLEIPSWESSLETLLPEIIIEIQELEKL
jgi:dTDP-4-dehydrorhamnose reductase